MSHHADVLIVTVTKVESKAVIEVFEKATGRESTLIPIGDKTYRDFGEINNAQVFMVKSEMGVSGPGASLQSVQKGIDALSPLAVVMVGIAFGVNDAKQQIGEILVSQQLRLYDLQRVGKDEIILRGDKPHASTWLIDRFRNADDEWDGAPVHFGVILTGEKLVDNVDYRDQLRRHEAEAIGGEMEGAGLYVACQDKKVDWILIKAICDWADGHKDENTAQRQQLAARNAAQFLLHTLQQAPLKLKNPQPLHDPSSDKESLQAQYDMLSQQLHQLKMDRIIETDTLIKFKLEKQIQEKEQELRAIEERISRRGE